MTNNEQNLFRYKVCRACYRLHSENFCPDCQSEGHIAVHCPQPIELHVIEERQRLLLDMTKVIIAANKLINEDK